MPRKEKEEITSLRRITKKGLKDLCKKNKLYQTPELNDVLYLHYQGFQDIECLEEYTGLKCLWLESNAISDIKGLENQKKLKCLFLHNNLIRKIENLESCRELDTLNLSSNHISRIENCGVDKLPVLTTLNLANNYLKYMEDLQNLTECKQLSVLDLANNRIEDILIVKILAEMPELRVLVLTGNPVVSRIPQYRKTLILECKELTYLDSRPVFPRDRACAEAWKRGGYEEERREHDRWNKADRKKIRDSVNGTLRLRNRGGGDPQVDLIASSSDEDDGFTERSSAPIKEDLQNMTSEDVNAEIIELMRLGDLVEYEQNEKCIKENVNNEQENEIEELKANTSIINQTEALAENKLMSANKCDEDSTPKENSEALERYDKTYKQAYENYTEYVKILMNQDTTIILDQSEEKGNTEELEVRNNDNCEDEINNNENDDSSENTRPNLLSTLKGEEMNSEAELAKEDKQKIELEKDSREINFVHIKNKDDVSIAESGNGKIEDITDSEIAKNDIPPEVQIYSDSEKCKKVNDPEKEFSFVKDGISIFPTSYFEAYSSVNSQSNNLSTPSYIFPEITKANENQLASGSDTENDELEEFKESHDVECKTTIREFVSNYKQFLGTINNLKSNEKKETESEKFNKVNEEQLPDTFDDTDSNSAFRKLRFFVQDCPEVKQEKHCKSQIIARLLENPITKEMSTKETCKTLEELDDQLKCIKEEQSKSIQKVSDKCYSLGDRYNDDVEVINGELVVIRKDPNTPNDTSTENIYHKDIKQVDSHTEKEGGLENDDAEIYEIANFVPEGNLNERIKNGLGESTEIIKCNENNSESKCKEGSNHTEKENSISENLANLGECSYLEYEPNFSNSDFYNNSKMSSDSDSIEEYFMPQIACPPKGQMTSINTGILSTLEISSKEDKGTKFQYNSTEIPSTSKACLGEQWNCNSFKIEAKFHDAIEIPSILEAISEDQQGSSPEKTAELQYDNSEVLSTLGVIAEEESSGKQKKCNHSEIKADIQNAAETPSTLEASFEERKRNYCEKEKELQYDAVQVLSILEEEIKDNLLETGVQYTSAENLSNLEICLKEEQKCNSSENGTNVQFDSAEIPPTSEGFSGKQWNYNLFEKEEDFHDAVEISSTLEANSGEGNWNFPEVKAELLYDNAEVFSTLGVISEEEVEYNPSKTELQYNSAELSSTFKLFSTSSKEEQKCYDKEAGVKYDSTESPSTSEATSRKQKKGDFSQMQAEFHDDSGISSTLQASSENKCNFPEKEIEHISEEKGDLSKKEKDLQYGAAEILFTLEASSEKGTEHLPLEEREFQYDTTGYFGDDPSSTATVKGHGNASENFEWVKSSIFSLAGGGMTEEVKSRKANTKFMYSSDPEIDQIHRDIDEDFHKDLTSLFINASLEYKMIESAEKYGDPEEDSPFDIEQRVQLYLEELKNRLPPEMKDMIGNENKNWHRFSGDTNEFRNTNNLDENPHIKRLHEILKSRNAVPGTVDKDKALLKLVLSKKDYLLNHEKPEARELAKRILKDNGIEDPDLDSVSTEVNLSSTSAEVVEERFSI